MDVPIRNIDELRNEIARLKGLQFEQKAALSARFSSPSAIFSSLFSFFPKSSSGEAKGNLLNQDIVGILSRIVLPFALNKTLFRHSNFIVKALVGLASQKASQFISEDSVTGLWGKAKGLFEKFTKKDKGKAPKVKNLQGYGIPPM